MPTQEDIIKTLKTVFDPEIPVNIYDLGLIYDVALNADTVNIKMTLTSQHCPAAQTLPETVKQKIAALEGITTADVQIVWEPAWTQARISEEGKKILGIA